MLKIEKETKSLVIVSPIFSHNFTESMEFCGVASLRTMKM